LLQECLFLLFFFLVNYFTFFVQVLIVAFLWNIYQSGISITEDQVQVLILFSELFSLILFSILFFIFSIGKDKWKYPVKIFNVLVFLFLTLFL